MSAPAHTYGPTCLLYEAPGNTVIKGGPDEVIPPPPTVRSQFFYLSSLPIDDPLTPITAPATGSHTQLPPRPFSSRDSIALEEAWQALRVDFEREAKSDARERGSRESTLKLRGLPEDIQRNRRGSDGQLIRNSKTLPVSRLRLEGKENKRSPLGAREIFVDGSVTASSTPPNPRKGTPPDSGTSKQRRRTLGSYETSERLQKCQEMPAQSTPKTPTRCGTPYQNGEDARMRAMADTNVTGSPFIRAPVRDRSDSAASSAWGNEDILEQMKRPQNEGNSSTPPLTAALELDGDVKSKPGDEPFKSESRPSSAGSEVDTGVTVTVGATRLHLVELPKLQMKPIYWSPVNDISSVIRATWFYKNTMLPVETDLANHLEEGYMELKPWTQTWQDELDSCMENGAEAEEKIIYKLWPNEVLKRAGKAGHESPEMMSVASTQGLQPGPQHDFSVNKAAGGVAGQVDTIRQFKSSSVIYVNAKEAQILRPSLLPSVARGRRPLGPVRKGRQIGIPVIRGFSPQLWDKLHPSKFVSTNARNFMKMREMASRPTASRRQICYACQMEDKRQDVSDLVLVIHGIGQKLSERVESFHFTHAINAFRKDVNAELSSDAVWPHMRPEQESIMVLPVNWRTTLSLEGTEGGISAAEDPHANQFTLKDITPDTIPGVRNLISDVMLDIPYYLSHHKQKMVHAVVKEANRIYRLWCQNNPGFQSRGHVHIIAHSLGTVMAMDILSHQPTILPPIDFSTTEINEAMFEFDTKNLFLCGSPVGFFLLLNKSVLLPRKGRNKPGVKPGEDAGRGITGQAGRYGCLAVDNIYNIMNDTDPIAYRLNAAVDADLANSLKPKIIPSSTTSLLDSISSVFRWGTAYTTGVAVPGTAQGAAATISKLPSNIELETHDFTREEIAETRMALLNDNGQIDYYLNVGGGPLNIQYLNMLSAHSSYWLLQDFVRFIVVEIGRVPGRDGALLALRAEKKKGWKTAKT
ncbi:DDHD domain-containing protein [Arthroderma uncinatum]|uniref:DDHD domain-containing protein n=1 Tax=Arthroderma uncinatum TaxID=74035 RepID=UPI00144ADD14|nr:DDHD domain-containing protein [Arthroderma uncinatum]KAF3482197.1 DDHD domain-containing protein [Arthroderma uncinatum]